MMQKHAKDNYVPVWAWIVSLVMVLVLIFALGKLFTHKLEERDALFAMQYNFTEDECTEWNEGISYSECLTSFVYGRDFQDIKEACELSKRNDGCFRYCHINRDKVGEECSLINVISFTLCQDDILFCKQSRSGWKCDERFSGCINVVNEDIVHCIPIFNTTQWGCQPGDAVRKWRELK